jgi:hypothetical protein
MYASMVEDMDVLSLSRWFNFAEVQIPNKLSEICEENLNLGLYLIHTSLNLSNLENLVEFNRGILPALGRFKSIHVENISEATL